MKRKVTAVASLTLATSIALNVYAYKVADHDVKQTPVEVPHYVDKQAVINALSTKAQIVGLTGKVSKTVEYRHDKWYGDKTYKLAATGTFKLGVSTSDIQISTEGNTVKVKFPQPKIISVDLPFDKAAVTKDVGMFRSDLSEGELQAMYGKARTGATEDIKRNRQAFEKAEASVERTIEALVGQVDGVKSIKFTEAK
jgi:hypothetical protein